MRVLERRGMPPRGSIGDRIAREMLYREHKLTVAKSMFLGRIMASGLGIPEKLMAMWCELFALEVHQESYIPRTVTAKESALAELVNHASRTIKESQSLMKKLETIEIRKDSDMLPLSPEEIEERRRHLRARHLKKVL